MTLSSPRNGSNTMGPQCMSGFLDKDYMYAVQVDPGGDGKAVRWNSVTNTYQSIVLSTIRSNRLEMPIVDMLDGHYGLALLVDDQDHVLIVGNHHDNVGTPTTIHAIECTNVADFTNPASWIDANFDYAAAYTSIASPGIGAYTYHLFERMTDGTSLHFFSQAEGPLGTSAGRDWCAFKRVAGTWSPMRGGVGANFATTENDAEPPDPLDRTADRVYVSGLLVEKDGGGVGVDRVHAWGVWRTNDADATSQRKPWYLYSDNLTTWKYKASGTDGTQTMPLTWANRTNAEVDAAFHPSYYQGLWIDPATGYPSFYARKTDDDGVSNSVKRRYSWNGTAWAFATHTSPLSGEPRDFTLNGARWFRANKSSQVLFRDAATETHSAIVGGTTLTGFDFSAWPDPVWLRERKRFAISMPIGATPQIYVHGYGATSGAIAP